MESIIIFIATVFDVIGGAQRDLKQFNSLQFRPMAD